MKKRTLFLITILFIISCEPEPGIEDTIVHYTIKNESTHNINLKVFDLFVQESNFYYDTTFLLNENSELVFQYKNLGTIDGVFGPATDSSYIIFDDIKQLKYIRGDGKNRNIFDINNWEKVKESDTYLKCRYLITDDDYNNAENIE